MQSTSASLLDTQNHWARLFIEALAQQHIITGFPNGLFRPDNSISRAEFATLLYKAFPTVQHIRQYQPFVDVPATHWATVAIQTAYETGFVSGFPNHRYHPDDKISRVDALVSLVAGLNLASEVKPDLVTVLPQIYQDALQIAEYAKSPVAIAECHKRNIELHAWFNPYRAKTDKKQGKNVHPHIAVTNPEVVYQWGNPLWMDPGAKVVQDRVYNVIMDVVQRYDVDGIHLDDYFYPYPIEGESFPDNKTYAVYKDVDGKLSLGDWRRENVNQMVLRLSTGIKAIKPYVKFGISPFGIYRPGNPEGITGLDAYNVLYADSKKWLEQGWVDYLAPQLYWRTDQTKQSYPLLLKWWTEINPKQRHIYAGNNIGQLDGKAWKDEEINKQVKISRSLVGDLSLGNIFFSVSAIAQNRQGIADNFTTSLYTQPALVPTMSWQNTAPSSPPIGLQVNNNRLTWQSSDNRKIRSWTLYKKSGETWMLKQIFSRETTAATVEPGTYAVCAVDRLANESVGIVVSVV